MWFCRLIKNCFALKDVDLRWVRVSAKRCRFARRRQLRLSAICWAQTAGFVSLRLLFRKNLCLCQIFFRSAVAENIFDLFRKKKCACLGGAERRRLYQDCHITLWTVFKISLGSVHDDMINSVLCINFANGYQEDFIFCLILLSDLLAKQNQNSTRETMAESSSVIQNECHTPTA